MTSSTIKTRRLFSDVSGDLHAQESRRKDRKLLDNITNKLYDMDNALVRPSDSITEVVSDVRRRLSGRELAPHTDLRLTKHRLRNASRAKVTPVTPSVQRVKRTVSEPLQPAIYPSYISTGHTTRSTALPPTAELAVRTARRCLSRLETELAGRNYADADDFDVPLRSRTLTQQSYKKPPVMPASYYLDDLDLDDDYYVPVSVPVRGRSLARTTPLAGAGAGGLSVRQTVRHRSLTPSKPAVTVTRRHLSSIDDDLDYEPPSYAGLRAKYTEAKNKLDLHKTMLDKYLPLYLGPENAVEIEVDYKFGELCARMPRLDPYRPLMNTNNNTLSSSKPPRGRPLNNFEKPTATHPKMSDTRKRVRDVICKTRNDKHYYD